MDYHKEALSLHRLFGTELGFDQFFIATPEGDFLGNEEAEVGIILSKHLPLQTFQVFVIHEVSNLLYPVDNPAKVMPISPESYVWFTRRKFDVDAAP